MLAAEKSLLIAVRDRLREQCGYSDRQCEVEYDEIVPAVGGDMYIVVAGGGWRPGPRHNTSGQVNDLIYAVDVCVVKRITSVPRDRRTAVYLRNLSALTEEVDKIYLALDWDYTTIMERANRIILEETGSVEGFINPLRFMGISRRPEIVGGDMFGSTQEPNAGLMRVINFGGARRVSSKTILSVID
jgi:hypothetical protein